MKGENFKMFIQTPIGSMNRMIVLQPENLTVSAIAMQIDEKTYQAIKANFPVAPTGNRDVEQVLYEKDKLIT